MLLSCPDVFSVSPGFLVSHCSYEPWNTGGEKSDSHYRTVLLSSVTTLKPLTVKLNDTDHLITVQHLTGNPLIPPFIWMPFDTTHVLSTPLTKCPLGGQM